MHLTFTAHIEVFIEKAKEGYASPEEFLLQLEEALESGELTVSEVRQMLMDYDHKSPKA